MATSWRERARGAALGLCVEIAFTDLFSGWSGSFRVSLLVVLVYTVAFLVGSPLLALAERGGDRPALRAPLTVLLVYAFEWSVGALCRGLGLTPWRYDHDWTSAFSAGLSTPYSMPRRWRSRGSSPR